MGGGRAWRVGRGSSLFRGVPRRPVLMLGCGSGRGGRPQVEGEGFLGLVAFQQLWFWVLGQRHGQQPVLVGTGSIAGAWPGAAKKELNFSAMLAQFGQRLQGLLSSQELPLCVSETLDQDITTSLTWTWSETESEQEEKNPQPRQKSQIKMM